MNKVYLQSPKYILLGIGTVIILASLIFFIYTLFFKSTPIVDQTVNLEYWGLFEPEEVMGALINTYEKEHPNVNIRYTKKNFDTNLDDYKKSLHLRLTQNTGPDIFRMHSTWISSYFSMISQTNESMDSAEFNNRFYKVMADGCVTSAGVVVCVPLAYDGLVLLYNADIFNDAGIYNPQIQTWEDFRLIAQKLNLKDARENLIRSGAAIGTSNNVVNFSDIIALMLMQSDVKIPAELDSSKTETVIKFYNSFADNGDHAAVWNANFPDSISAFAVQQTAMVFVKSEQMLKILEINPTLNFKAIPVPQLPVIGGGVTTKNISSYWVESVSAQSSNAEQEEAWKFLNWLSLPEQQIARFNQESIYKKFGEPYSHKQLRNNLINSPLLGPIIEFAPNAQLSYLVDDSGNDAFISALAKLVESFTGSGGGDTKSALTQFKDAYIKLANEKL